MVVEIEKEKNDDGLIKLKMYQIYGLAVPLIGWLVFVIYLFATGQKGVMFYSFSVIWIMGLIIWIIAFRKRHKLP